MVSAELVINSNYIKYQRLHEIVNTLFVGSTDNEINVFIDMSSVMAGIYQKDCSMGDHYSIITSCLVNMCAHFRHFFYKYNVNSKIFLVYSQNTSFMNNKICLGYNKKKYETIMNNPQITDIVNYNLKLLSILCPYIPDVAFIQGSFETGVLINDVIVKEKMAGNVAPSIIITKDIYNYQLVSNNNRVYIFRPKKGNGEDLSYAVTEDNVFQTIIAERGVAPQNYDIPLSPVLVSTFLAMTRLPERSLYSIMDIPVAFRILVDAVRSGVIINGRNSDIYFVMDMMSRKNLKYSKQFNEAAKRFTAIDIAAQYSMFINTKEVHNYTHMTNLYDPNAVKGINQEYFDYNPLDLNSF